MNDFDFQAEIVVRSVERIFSLMDRDPLSPTYGCCHLGYWRDKTSDIADMRRQEAALPLAMLYARDYPGSSWRGDPRLIDAVTALLTFWCRNRYADGSMDEWYKGERGFAVAAFSTHAVARTLIEVGDKLPPDLVALVRQSLSATAHHLVGRDDLFKTNHQAVAVAALAYAGHVLADDALTANARDKLVSIVASQTTEGWFPEVRNMDVGYIFLTVEYVAYAMELWNDFSAVEPFRRAYDFAAEWVHPDLTLGDEYGVCHNPYVSRIATLFMSARSGRAAFLRNTFDSRSAGLAGAAATLSDDLRLCRWAFQPLLAHSMAADRRIQALPPEVPPLFAKGTREIFYKDSGLACVTRAAYAAIAAPAAGGLVRVFSGPDRVDVTDAGYAVTLDDGTATNTTYDRFADCRMTEGALTTSAPISVVRKFFPPYWARVGLRLACSTAIGSRLARRLIDVYRASKGSALNQSSVNLKGRSSAAHLEREVRFGEETVTIVDTLIFESAVPLSAIRPLISECPGQKPKPMTLPAAGDGAVKSLRIRKAFDGRTGDRSISIEETRS